MCEWLLSYPYCQAFPFDDGIPQDVRDGTNGHSASIKGDNGFRYQRAEASNISDDQFVRELREAVPDLSEEEIVAWLKRQAGR